MKRFTGICVLFAYIAFGIFPQQLWTGTAVSGSSADFPEGGLVAASNSFPIGTFVDVTNPSTGETLRVQVTSRVNESGVFLLLSQEAATQLGVGGRYPAIVQAEPSPAGASQATQPGSVTNGTGDTPFSTDPDLNPAATLGDPNAFLFDDSPIPELEGPIVDSDLPPIIAEGTSGTGPVDLPLDTGQVLAVQPDTQPESGPTSTTGTTAGPATDAGQPDTSQSVDPPGATTPTASIPEPEVPSTEPEAGSPTPAQGISSALRSFQDPNLNAQSLLAQRLTAAQPAADPETEPSQTPETGPEASPPGPSAGPETEPSSQLAHQPQVEIPEPESGTAPVSQTATPDTAAQPNAETGRYATPLLGDPAAESLNAYRNDFAQSPLTRSSVGGDLETPSLAQPQVPGPRTATVETPQPAVALPEASQDDIARVESGVGPVAGSQAAGIPEPNFPLGDAQAGPERLTPVISSVPSVALPAARYQAEAETFDDFLAPLAAPGQPPLHPSVARLPQATTPGGLESAAPSIARVTPRGIVAGVDRSVPEPRFSGQGTASAGPTAPQAPDSETGPTAIPEAPLAFENADPTITGPDSPAAPEYLITLVPAEFRPPGATEAADSGAPDASIAGTRALETEQSTTIPTASTDPLNPDILAAADPGRGTDPSLGLRSPGLDDPDALAAANPAAAEGANAALRDPRIPGPEALASAEAGPGRDPDGTLGTPGLEDPEALGSPSPGAAAAGTAALASPADPSGVESPLAGQAPASTDGGVALSSPEATGPEEDPPLGQPAAGTDSASDLMVFLQPAEARTPGAASPDTAATVTTSTTVPSTATTQPTQPAATALAGLPLVERLQSDAFYVQLGAFSNPESARNAIGTINPGYPVTVHPVSGVSQQLYRLYIGPLNEDEKGTALFWFRAKGYRDAFIRSGAESL